MAYMVRQSIMDKEQNVLGYEMRYYDETAGTTDNENTAANAVSNILTQLGDQNITDEKPVFLNFTWNLLQRKVPEMFNTENLIMIVEDSIIIDPKSTETMLEYKKAGYKIAIADFLFMPRYFGVLDSIDYIRLNFKYNDTSNYASIIKLAKAFDKKIIGYDIETKEAYDLAVSIGCDYFVGSFVAEKMPTEIKKTDFLQGNFFQLLAAVTRPEVNYNEVSEIISRDVNLTFALLKLVNSAWFALRNKASTIKQALVVLGVGQLKQWIYLLSFRQSNGKSPDELIKLSFLRATFAQELSKCANELPINSSEAYLLGMFSTLEKLTDTSFEDALKDLSISEDIKKALISGEGKCGTLLNVILCYESANWHEMQECAQELGIPNEKINHLYFECVEQVNKIWNGITHSE